MDTLSTSTVSVAGEPNQVASKPKLRIEFLDGMRGLAALFVVIFHALKIHDGIAGPSKSDFISNLFFYYPYYLFRYGRFAVVIFLVISGYSLMLPIARSATGSFPKGKLDYFKRRFRRILPPYYAALILSLVIIAFVPGMNTIDTANKFNDWNNALPAFSPGVLISHFFMFHNWRADWIFNINAPLWSIPIEFQLYFLFPFVFIPLWKRFGSIVLISVAVIAGLIPPFLFPKFFFESSWFISLFVMGLIGASISFPTKPVDRWLAFKISWGKASLLFSGLLVLAMFLDRKLTNIVLGPVVITFRPIMELFVGFTTISLIIFLVKPGKTTYSKTYTVKNILLKILTNKLVLLLGSFSYSLYLVHHPLEAIANNFCQWLGLPATAIYSIEIALIPLIMVIAYIFHLLFERPFINTPKPSRVELPLNPVRD